MTDSSPLLSGGELFDWLEFEKGKDPRPTEALRDLDWLTTAWDAEEDMQVVIDEEGTAVRYDIKEVNWDREMPYNCVIILKRESDGQKWGFTADEIDSRRDVVVV